MLENGPSREICGLAQRLKEQQFHLTAELGVVAAGEVQIASPLRNRCLNACSKKDRFDLRRLDDDNAPDLQVR